MATQEGVVGQRAQAGSVSGPALALPGGGLRASSIASGLTSGLMAVAHATRPGAEETPTLLGTGLYARIASIASVSGGSWFAAELIYSERFVRLIDAMAAFPDESAELHRRQWTEPWMGITDKDSPYVKMFARLAKRLNLTGIADDILLFGYLWKSGFTWTKLTLAILEATGGIDMSVALGSPVSPWAEGKAWLVAHAVATPSSRDMLAVHIAEHRWPACSATQSVSDSPGLSLFTPAMYSYVLGSGDASAPVPYVAASALPPASRLNYRGVVRTSLFRKKQYAADARADNFGALERGAQELSVVSCAAASSAAMGHVVLFPAAVTQGLDAVGVDLAVWQSASDTVPARDAFERAASQVRSANVRRGVSQAALDGLAEGAVQAVMDAGFSDVTGIAYAIRAGAREVVAYLNNTKSNVPADLAKLCLGGSKFMFGGSALSQNKALCVFAQPADDVLRAYAALPKLRLCAGARFVTAISVGTLYVTTAKNDLFGIPSGVPVMLHIIGVASKVTMGGLEDVYDFDALTQEVIQTMAAPDNAPLVQGTVMPWFFASAADKAQPSEVSTDTPASDRAAESEPGHDGAGL